MFFGLTGTVDACALLGSWTTGVLSLGSWLAMETDELGAGSGAAVEADGCAVVVGTVVGSGSWDGSGINVASGLGEAEDVGLAGALGVAVGLEETDGTGALEVGVAVGSGAWVRRVGDGVGVDVGDAVGAGVRVAEGEALGELVRVGVTCGERLGRGLSMRFVGSTRGDCTTFGALSFVFLPSTALDL